MIDRQVAGCRGCQASDAFLEELRQTLLRDKLNFENGYKVKVRSVAKRLQVNDRVQLKDHFDFWMDLEWCWRCIVSNEMKLFRVQLDREQLVGSAGGGLGLSVLIHWKVVDIPISISGWIVVESLEDADGNWSIQPGRFSWRVLAAVMVRAAVHQRRIEEVVNWIFL